MDNLQSLITALLQGNQHLLANTLVGNYQTASGNTAPQTGKRNRRQRRRSSATTSQQIDNNSSISAENKVKTPRRNQRTPKVKHSVSEGDSPKNNLKDEYVNYNLSSPSTSGQQVKHQNISKEKMPNLTCTFTPNIPVGSFIRFRNTHQKYVRLRTFLGQLPKIPSIFKTDLSRINSLISLNSNNTENNKQHKIASRKFLRIGDIKKQKKEGTDTAPFPNYLSESEVEAGLANGFLVKGFIRINPKNNKDAYVNNEDSSVADYYLNSIIDRNRALEGDEVVLKIKPKSEWINGQKTAVVVFIKQKIHPRIVVGHLKPSSKPKADYVLFYPRDKRCPSLRIPQNCCPNGFKRNFKNYENILFVAKIESWEVPGHAKGMLTESLGSAGDLRVETLSILREFCLDITPFPDEMKAAYLPLTKEIPQKEFEYREDLRHECIFTIDPETARDLDDAVSVKELSNDTYEIGVHISDASYFLKQGTELDEMVSKKATTIYLVDSVYHMLPEELCLHCSLLPGQDKLAFSVFWEMTADGEIIKKRFCRSIVNSCAKLAYEHAQKIIDNSDGELLQDEFPQIYNNFNVNDISKAVTILQKIAVNLRQKRVNKGALRIDQVKLIFSLEPVTGEPLDFRAYENMAAHRLIEEFMLLANITVAEKIQESYPEIAFLRCHEPPKQTMLVDLKKCLETYGLHIDTSSSGAIRSSIEKYETTDFAGKCRSAVLNHLTAKAMTRAKYFCAALTESEDEFKHYALSVPIYTHFTSPIRRYADIMVHRLLAASLGYCDRPQWEVDYVAGIAANCNGQKYNAKRAGEASSELYLSHYVEKHKPYIQDCVVVDVKERSFDALVLKTGSIIRVYQNNCEEGTVWKTEVIPVSSPSPESSRGEKEEPKHENVRRQLKLIVTFPKTAFLPKVSTEIEIFSRVKISLEKKNKSYKLEGTLLRPIQPLIFSKINDCK